MVVSIPARAREYSLLQNINTDSGSPPSLLFSGYIGAVASSVKWPRHEADRTPPSSTNVKNLWSYTPLSHAP